METNSASPDDILNQLEVDAARLRRRMLGPWWYYAALGLFAGTIVMTGWFFDRATLGVTFVCVGLTFAALALNVAYQWHTGVNPDKIKLSGPRIAAMVAYGTAAIGGLIANIVLWAVGAPVLLAVGLAMVVGVVGGCGTYLVDRREFTGGAR